ncbi:MAG: signal peptidase I [Limnobacter sp.]|nr:signal peptidase I [Limnobacter sp.]
MNFSLVLFLLVLFTGVFYIVDLFFFRPVRKQEAELALETAQIRGRVSKREARYIRNQYLRPPMWLEYTGSFFPVILFVFVLRSFVIEPFKIPSGSMVPTLLVGDLILVNKFTYGIRLPIIDKKIIELNDPKKGDVMVFRYPVNPSLDYIKRVVGVGGDLVEYRDKKLYINGKLQPQTKLPDYYDPRELEYFLQYKETLAGKDHRILNSEDAPGFIVGLDRFPYKENCSYDVTGFRCKVPENHYFMMGDNRDNSSDSRVWGFVSDDEVVGKAFLVWMNFSDFSRIGLFY